FATDDLMALIDAIQRGAVTPLTASLPASLADVTYRALSHSPSDRFSSSSEMRAALRAAFAESGSAGASPPSASISDELRRLRMVRPSFPAQTTSFVGRKVERATLRELLSRSRMLSLTGSGGTGKTRL